MPDASPLTLDDVSVLLVWTAIAIYAGGRGSVRAYKRGDGLTKVELPIAPFLNAFCRITVLTETGTRAWTSPIWLDELNIT